MSNSTLKDTRHRFSDVTSEPCIMLTPLNGFLSEPLVSIEAATENLESIVKQIKQYVIVAKSRIKIPADGLSIDESAAIQIYTMEWEQRTDSLYHNLNSRLRNPDRDQLKPWFPYLKLLWTALSKLPSTKEVVYRGTNFQDESEYMKYEKGKDIVWWGFSSCSKNEEICKKIHFLGQTGRRIIFIINSINGKDISEHSYYKNEREVVLVCGTTFRVVSYSNKTDGTDIIYLEEVDPNSTSPSSSQTSLLTDSSFLHKLKRKLLIRRQNSTNTTLQLCISSCETQGDIYLNARSYTENNLQLIAEKLIIAKQCRRLFLNECDISSNGASIISRALPYNKMLEYLSLSHNKIGDQGTIEIAQRLSAGFNSNIKELYLRFNGITDRGVEALSTMLITNTTLTHLCLAYNKITERGLQLFIDVLMNKNKTLKSLALEWNTFQNFTNVESLILMFKQHEQLVYLNLSNSALSKSTTDKLSSEAREMKNLRLILK